MGICLISLIAYDDSSFTIIIEDFTSQQENIEGKIEEKLSF